MREKPREMVGKKGQEGKRQENIWERVGKEEIQGRGGKEEATKRTR